MATQTSYTVARPYAKAVFDQALQENGLNSWHNLLALLAQLAADERTCDFLAPHAMTAQQQTDFLCGFLGKAMAESQRRYVMLLVANKRLGIVQEVFELFQRLVAAYQSTTTVTVKVAQPLSQEQQQKLQQKLDALLGKQVVMHCSVEPSLIGGMIVQTNNWVLDRSIRSRFGHLRQSMTQ